MSVFTVAYLVLGSKDVSSQHLNENSTSTTTMQPFYIDSTISFTSSGEPDDLNANITPDDATEFRVRYQPISVAIKFIY